MRDVKFRVLVQRTFLQDENQFVWEFFSPLGGCPCVVLAKAGTLGQYTGFRDAKGVEIHEGDVLSDGGRCFEVRFVDGGFALVTEFGEHRQLRPMVGALVVIGNVHQNPELMEVK